MSRRPQRLSDQILRKTILHLPQNCPLAYSPLVEFLSRSPTSVIIAPTSPRCAVRVIQIVHNEGLPTPRAAVVEDT